MKKGAYQSHSIPCEGYPTWQLTWDIISGIPFKLRTGFDFKEIHQAKVTDSSFLFDGFDLMSNNFSSLLDSLELNVNSKNYNNLIESCLSCHILVCPGPISKIDKMFID